MERTDGIYASETTLNWESDDGRRSVDIELYLDGSLEFFMFDNDHTVYDSHYDQYVVDSTLLIPAEKAPAFLTALQAWIEQLSPKQER